MEKKIKDAIFSTLVVSNPKSWPHCWEKIKKLIPGQENEISTEKGTPFDEPNCFNPNKSSNEGCHSDEQSVFRAMEGGTDGG